MAPRRGTSPRPPSRWVNPLGFVTFSLAAVALLAAVVLLPAYATMLDVRHERELRACRNQDMQSQYDAGERVIEAAETDPTFMERLAISQGEFVLANRSVIHLPQDSRSVRPDVVTVEPMERPAGPPAWVRNAAGRVSNPQTRRGLLMMAGGMLLVAGLVFTGRFSSGDGSDADA